MQYYGVVLVLFHVVLRSRSAASSPPSPPDPDQHFSFGPNCNPSMAITMLMLISLFFFLGFFSIYIRDCVQRRLRGGDGGGEFEDTSIGAGGGGGRFRRVGRGLDPEVIESFPTFKYAAVKCLRIGKNSLECAVCINEFGDDEIIRLLPKCSHVFHPECIDVWLVTHSTCPVCRANLVPKPGEILSTSIQIFESDNKPEIDELNLITMSTNETAPRRMRSQGFSLNGLFPRSYSTGHFPVQPGENQEKFTLRLPDELRVQIMNSTLNRAKSYAAFPTARSWRTGFRSGGGTNYFHYERFNREEMLDRRCYSMTPPFISRTRWTRGGSSGGGEATSALTPPRNVFNEQSSDRLRQQSQV